MILLSLHSGVIAEPIDFNAANPKSISAWVADSPADAAFKLLPENRAAIAHE